MRSRLGLIALVALSCGAGSAGPLAAASTGQAPAVEGRAPAAASVTSNSGSVQTPTGAATRIVSVSAVKADGQTRVSIKGNGRLVPKAVEAARDLPPRVLVDFPGVESGVAGVTLVNSPELTRVRVAANSTTPLVTRVVLDLKRKVPYDVERKDDELVIVLGSGSATLPSAGTGAALAAIAPKPETAASATPSSAPAPSAPAPSAPASATPAPKPAPAAPATAAPTPKRAPETTAAAASPARSRERLAGAPAQEPPRPNPPAGTPPGPPAGTTPRPPAGTTNPAPSMQAPMPSERVVLPGTLQAGEERRFVGEPVTLDFQGVDLRAVLRTFSEISGLNLVIDDRVQGKVDVSLREVPWDQALDIILRANRLGYSVDGNIVRIAPIETLRKEQEELRQLAEEQAKAGDLQMMTQMLSYAKAEEMASLLKGARILSPRGSIHVDERTNTLIIQDLPANLEATRQLIASLDSAQPQVEIEARIVQTNRNFLRELGMKWGVRIEASQRLGNPTGLVYPNQVGAAGSTSLPTVAPSSILALATSSINGAFNLDVELQAAERQGKVRILSTPRVSTQNNVEAEISQGTQIPVQTVANNTVTVTFKDATLTLKVKPQITSSNTVIMNVTLENASPDYTREVNGIPPIDTQRANTQVQVNDGATTVIGGIFVSSERQVSDRTPGLHSIPILGWLFKSNNTSETSQELLIFLTPRIIKS